MTLFRVGLASLLVFYAMPFAHGDEGDPQDRFARAWVMFESDRKPAEAAETFRALASDPSVPREIRARSAVALARCERALGRASEAERLLRQVLEEHGDLLAVVTEARDALRQVTGGRTRWFVGTAALGPGQWLDLDTGGVYPGRTTFSGTPAEVGRDGDRIALPADAVEDPDFDRHLGSYALAPWSRVKTDEGRLAWVQVLVEERSPFLRFVTRSSGQGPVLRSPDPMFAVGREGRIEVHFEPARDFERYRVERRVGADGTFAPFGETQTSPFRDSSAKAGERYGYRVTGIAANGDEGIPAFVQATTSSRGVIEGSVELDRTEGGNAVDLITGDLVPRARADLVLTGTYGGRSGASFADGEGRPVVAVEGPHVRAAWLAPEPPSSYVETGKWFALPVRGGGVARGRVTFPPRGREVRVDYAVYPDSDLFPEPPRLAARRGDAGVEVTVDSPRGYVVQEVTGRAVGHAEESRRLPIRDGMALDTHSSIAGIVEYAAVAVDAHGRAGSAGRTTFNGMPKGIRHGTFRFHYGQAWSIERESLVPVEEADVVFQSAAGGISSVTLAAPGGIASLRRVMDNEVGRARGAGSVRLFAASLVGVSPRLGLDRQVQCDDRAPASDVAVLRSRSGGWARLAIVRRGAEGGWTDRLITVEYAFNPHEPVFADRTQDGIEHRGFVTRPLETVRRERREASFARVPSGVRRGSFRFHYKQGWSIESDRLVSADEADVVFRTCAGGISSITLAAPEGIASLRKAATRDAGSLGRVDAAALGEFLRKVGARALVEAVVSIDPDVVQFTEETSCDLRDSSSDVAVLRTRNGGWALVAIVDRGQEGGWTDYLATIEYAFNPHEPVFRERPERAIERGGFVLDERVTERLDPGGK